MELNFDIRDGLPKGFDYSGNSWLALSWYEHKRHRVLTWINSKWQTLRFRVINFIVNFNNTIDKKTCVRYRWIAGKPVKNKGHDYFYNYFNDRLCKICNYAPEGHKPVEEIMVQVRSKCKCGHSFESHILEKGLGCTECDCEQMNAFHEVDWKPSDENMIKAFEDNLEEFDKHGPELI